MRANMVHRRFQKCAKHVKIYLFRTYFTSLFCMATWEPNDKQLNEIRVAYNNSFRIIFSYKRQHSASTMFAKNRVNDFTAIRRVAVYSLMRRCNSSRNVIINSLYHLFTHQNSQLNKKWTELLYV